VIGIIPILISSIAVVMLMLNTTNNNSPGAIDDASGVACVYELLNFYNNPENRLSNFNLWFVFTGAEECGTMGIRFFFDIISDFDKSSTYLFNFDTIGQAIYLFPNKNPTEKVIFLYKLLLDNNMGQEIKHYQKRTYFGAHSDGGYLFNKDFSGIGVGDLDVYQYIHSIHDTPENIDYTIIKNLCEMITDALSIFDKQL
jgi:Zn-dependent M28 family amino/carboxypeptidase